MATSNEAIRDAIIRHEIDILRFKGGLSRRITRLLDRVEPELRTKIRQRLDRIAHIGYDPGPATTERMLKISRLIALTQSDTWEQIRKLVRSELAEIGKIEADFLKSAFAASLPVSFDLALPNSTEIAILVRSNPIKGELLRDWLSNYERNDRRRMMEQIREGLVFGETPVQISRRIFGSRNLSGADGVRQISRKGATTLANTATSSIANAVKQDVYQRNKKIIKQELYVATLDSRTSPICRSLDGKRYPVGEGPIPPVHINCRSTRVPIIDGRQLGTRPANATTASEFSGLTKEEKRKRVSELIGPVPAEQTYSDFLRNQSAKFQNEVLGPTRAKLFRSGDVTLDQFVDHTGRQYNLKELRERIPAAFD